MAAQGAATGSQTTTVIADANRVVVQTITPIAEVEEIVHEESSEEADEESNVPSMSTRFPNGKVVSTVLSKAKWTATAKDALPVAAYVPGQSYNWSTVYRSGSVSKAYCYAPYGKWTEKKWYVMDSDMPDYVQAAALVAAQGYVYYN